MGLVLRLQGSAPRPSSQAQAAAQLNLQRLEADLKKERALQVSCQILPTAVASLTKR